MVVAASIIFSAPVTRAADSTRFGTLSGIITDEQGRGLRAASIFVMDAQRGGVTSSSGRFSFAHLQPGIYRARVTHPEYLTAEREVRVAPSKTTLVRVRLKRRPIILHVRYDSIHAAVPILRPARVKRGILYFAGHRVVGPMTIDFDPEFRPGFPTLLVVNGRRIRRDEGVIADDPADRRDTLTWKALWEASSVAYEARRRGRSRQQTLTAIRVRLDPRRRKAVVRGDSVSIPYRGPFELKLVLPRGPFHPSHGDQRYSASLWGYARLHEAKNDLERGALLLFSRYGWTRVSADSARPVDEAIRALQSGRRLTRAQDDLLGSTLRNHDRSDVMRPARLERVQR